jgi:hypothetical protein
MRLLSTLTAAVALILSCASGAVAATKPKPAASTSCNAACLETHLQRYLSALAAHQPANAALAADAKLTENGVPTTTDKGVWTTATGFGDYRIVLSDPTTGQAAFVGDLKEGAASTMLAVRIKVSRGRISEAETIVGRAAIPGPTVLPAPRASLSAPTPAIDPLGRAEMIKTTERYIEAAAHGGAEIFAADCQRVENRKQMTGNPGSGASIGCDFHFNTLDGIEPRRIVLVDQARQMAFGVFMLNWYGAPGCTRAGGRACPAPTGLLSAEVLNIRGGKVHDVEVVCAYTPYKAPTGWDPR